jgi:hypothetical protein
MTSEKFITLLSITIVLITTVFSSVVFVKELIKPSDVLERTLLDNCRENKVLKDKITDENELEKAVSDCVFISEELMNSSEFTKKLNNLQYLMNFDYLFIGKKGVLLKKNSTDHKKDAEYIYKCFKDIDCSNQGSDDSITVTYLMQDTKGEVAISTTYNDLPAHQTVKNFKNLHKEISAIKNLSADLRLTLLFHKNYTFIEDKTPENVIALLKRKIDGLYLKSRGAKIRVLPWEYSDNPVNVLDRKGRQYGLDKEEYKKDEASIYHYRTVQFIEKDGEMVPWLGIYNDEKSSYSDNLSILLISKHLKNIQSGDGSFPAEMNIVEGDDKGSKDNLNIQAETAIALFKASVILKDESLADSAVKTIGYLIKKSRSAEISSALLLDLLTLCGDKCSLQEHIEKKQELIKSFGDIENIKNGIAGNPVYSGIFLKAFLIASQNNLKADPEIELLKNALEKYSGMNSSDKLRFISYLMWTGYQKNSAQFEMIRTFLNLESSLIKESLFDDRGFNDFKGSFRSSGRKNIPDTALSVLIASGLSRAVSFEYHSETLLEIESLSGNYLRYLIVTDDDLPNWGNAQAKNAVQGGVRAFPGADTVKLANSARVLEYFVNRSIKGRAR